MKRQANDIEQYELAIPRPDALVESLRSMGYSLSTAIADIVDNSIAASAQTIWIDFHWNGPDSTISILDDGNGMSERVLFEALRPGSQSPLQIRSPQDLGRFGLGLKTASFSQCRRLTVASRASGGPETAWRWDLDYVERHKEWRLLRGVAMEDDRFCREFRRSSSRGTLVLWGKLDRVVDQRPANDALAQEHFHELIFQVREHLAMTFHRYMAGESRILDHPLQIFVNGRGDQHRLEPWDPFLKSHPATYRSPLEVIGEGETAVAVQGFVLPHRDRLSDPEYQLAAGPRGWVAQQGYYIYRNDRILVAGDWLRLGRDRLFQKDEHYRLARLSIDISNRQDFDWSLDVKKSTARPPVLLRERLTDLAEIIRSRARQAFFHRGLVGPNPLPEHQAPLERPWIAKERAGRNVYAINRQHPVVLGVFRKLGPLKVDVDALLRLVEETVPVERIWLDTSETPGAHAAPYEALDEDLVWSDLRRTFALLRDSGYSTGTAIKYLRSLEPFNRYQELVSRLEDL